MWKIENTNIEKAVLIGLKLPFSAVPAEESLSELYQLTKTAGAKVIGKFIQDRRKPHPAHYFGSGKVQEVKEYIIQNKLDMVVVDDELTPTQERNLEEEFGCKVIDRTRLILDIFAIRASSSVGKLQVELAQMEYFKPRLRNIWEEFSKLGGGIGVRGPGEKKIEIDRRIINDRIAAIKRKLDKISKHRKDRRKQRKESHKKIVSLVGYTNSGKSTLMNVLSGAKVEVANKLFLTLSPTTRKINSGKYEILLTDTVGFIRKLPHQVVNAFMATLEEIQEADMLLQIVDISTENYRHRIEAVNNVLGELKVMDKPLIRVYNKIDMTEHEPRVQEGSTSTVYISALEHSGIDMLRDIIDTEIDKCTVVMELKIPQARQDIINSVYNNTTVLEREYLKNSVILKCRADDVLPDRYRKFLVK